MADAAPHVVVVGGGFAGLEATKRLAKRGARVTLVDRTNHHLFQPLLYQVATAALAAPDIAAPIRRLVRGYPNVTVLLDEVTAVDADNKTVTLRRAGEVGFDSLLVAAGAGSSYFGHDEWEEHAPSLKTLEDAFEVRRRVLHAFEEAEIETDPDKRRALLTFVVVGAGPTGVELAGAIAEIAHVTLARDFRTFDPRDTHVFLVEGGDQVLPAYDEQLGARGKEQLEKLGVTVRLSSMVEDITAEGVTIAGELLPARTVLWAAGVRASPLGTALGDALGAEVTRAGQVKVDAELTVGGRDDIYVAGDLAHLVQGDQPVPGLAPAAIQMGRHAADNILRAHKGRALAPFVYLDKGSLATIGRKKAVGKVLGLRVSGVIAWLGWLFVHLLYLVGFRNRLVVLFEWAWAYISWQRSARVVVPDQESTLSDSGAPVPVPAGDRDRIAS